MPGPGRRAAHLELGTHATERFTLFFRQQYRQFLGVIGAHLGDGVAGVDAILVTGITP